MIKNKRHIILEIPTNLSHLSGKEYGKHIYQTQVEAIIQKSFQQEEIPVIVFPAHICGVSITFVKGFCEDLLQGFSKQELIRKVNFLSTNFYMGKVVEKSVLESILF